MSEKTRFSIGQLVATPGALGLAENGINLPAYLRRHMGGDWGDLCEEDKLANETAVSSGTRVFSAYETPLGKLWIITEADRSATTFLLPSEY